MRVGLTVSVLWGAVMMTGSLVPGQPSSLLKAEAPGDVIIGILNSIHNNKVDPQAWNRPTTACADFNLISFVQVLAAIHTIEVINNSSLLPGIRLGYKVCDSCQSATQTLHCVEHMLAVNNSIAVLSDYSHFTSPVKAFLGERYSELSIPMSRMLSLYLIPQISSTASAVTLSDKMRFPSFYRVIPNDSYQTQALAKLIRYFSWTRVGVVSLNEDYGRAALESFLRDADREKVCVEYQEVLPTAGVMERHMKAIGDRIRFSYSEVVLLILRPMQVEMLFKEMISSNTTKVWIASDSWSTAQELINIKDINKVGDIFGFTFVGGNIPGFEDYLRNLSPSPGGTNQFIKEYKESRFHCSSPSSCRAAEPPSLNDDFLIKEVNLNALYGQRVAVYAIAHAIRTLLDCNDTACPGEIQFTAQELTDVLYEMNFTVDGETQRFNKDNDFENSYDLIRWKQNDGTRELEVVGKFHIQNRSVDVNKDTFSLPHKTDSVSVCTESCPSGTVKTVSNVSCCYKCINCSEGTYSNQTDQAECKPCPLGTTSGQGASYCRKWDVWYLKWSAAHSIVVLIGTVIGFLLLGFSFIFFILHRDNDLIRDVLLTSCIMKVGLMVSFMSVIIFFGDPTDHHCKAQQAMYGLGFTLCVAGIWVKAFSSLLAVMSDSPHSLLFLSRFDKPLLNVLLLTLVQALICTIWFVYAPPKVVETTSQSQPFTLTHLCTQENWVGFVFMHVYIAVLAIGCFLLAFKGRDEETEHTVFSMLFHLFVWFCFIPIFITQTEQRPIVQVSAVMVSNYGVIFCHFTPKWFQIFYENVVDKMLMDSGTISNHTESTEVVRSTPITMSPTQSSTQDCGPGFSPAGPLHSSIQHRRRNSF